MPKKIGMVMIVKKIERDLIPLSFIEIFKSRIFFENSIKVNIAKTYFISEFNFSVTLYFFQRGNKKSLTSSILIRKRIVSNFSSDVKRLYVHIKRLLFEELISYSFCEGSENSSLRIFSMLTERYD